MSLLRLVPFTTLASALLLLAGCGGKVVFQEDGGEGGNGGAGANGPGPGPGPSTTGTTTNNTSTSTGSQMTSCEQLCTQFPECFDPSVDCVAQCESFYVAGCELESEAFLQCFLAVLRPGCEFPEDACFNEEQALQQCQSTGDCTNDFCEVFGEGCSCSGQCFGSPLEETCFSSPPDPGPPPGAPVTCDCYTNGQFLGSCQADELVCDLNQGCCKFLFVDG